MKLKDGDRWACPVCGAFFGVVVSPEWRAFVRENTWRIRREAFGRLWAHLSARVMRRVERARRAVDIAIYRGRRALDTATVVLHDVAHDVRHFLRRGRS